MSIVYLKVELKSESFQFTEVTDRAILKKTENIYDVKFSKLSEFIETYIQESIDKNKEKKDNQFILRIYHKAIDICEGLLDGYDNLVVEWNILTDSYKVYLSSICYDKVKSRQLIDTSNERLKTLLFNICNNTLNDSSLNKFKA